MVVRRVGVLSIGKVTGVLYALMGLIFGAFYSLIALIGLATSAVNQDSAGMALSALFGVGAVIILPLLYGAMGAGLAMISALLYNVVAGYVGGIRLEVE